VIGLLETPVVWVALTTLTYVGAKALYARIRFFLLHPVLLTVAVLIAVLQLLGVDFETYNRGGQVISFFLGPSVVALGIPLYQRLQELREQAPAMLATTLAGSVVGIVSAVVPLLILGVPEVVTRSMSPKSVTTPIAIAIAEGIGGDQALTAGFVVTTGILGAIIGPVVLRVVGVRNDVAFGLAMGSAAHGVGTARALEEGRLSGAAGSLGICLNGIATAILTPPLVRALLSIAL